MSPLRGWRRSRHLGDRAAALVDGQLGHDARDRALAHIAGCPPCRQEVDSQRRLKARLRRLSDPPVPDGLAERLLTVGGDGGEPPPPRPTLRRRARPARPRRRSDVRRPRPVPAGTHRRRGRLVVAGSASFLVAGLAVAFVAGGSQPPGPTVTPAVDRYVVEHAATTNIVPLPDSGIGAAVTVSNVGAAGP